MERSDETTKICENCFRVVYDFVRLRELCAGNNETIQESEACHSESRDDVNGQLSPMRKTELVTANPTARFDCPNRNLSRVPSIECISLLDDETDSEVDEGNTEPKEEKQHPFASEKESSLCGGRVAAMKRGRSYSDDPET